MFYIKHKIRHDLHSHPGNGQLEKPVSLTYDPKGNILILDNERIQVSISPKQVFCLKITLVGLFWCWGVDKSCEGTFQRMI